MGEITLQTEVNGIKKKEVNRIYLDLKLTIGFSIILFF